MEKEDKSFLPEEYRDLECLMLSEVEVFMTARQQAMQEENQAINPTFEKMLAYVQRFSKYKNTESVKHVRQLLADEKLNLSQSEQAMLANLAPEEAEEAKHLIPSLQRTSDSELNSLLENLQNYRRF
eukprot:gb/GECH01013639.1/.p1 GENE.gb/GECH01013639.1/~~gb/GECH01013639.1/.p1  ORF type:complete len:127 (+),score=30.59 gb/GECH01013639.1/:1-381(+)